MKKFLTKSIRAVLAEARLPAQNAQNVARIVLIAPTQAAKQAWVPIDSLRLADQQSDFFPVPGAEVRDDFLPEVDDALTEGEVHAAELYARRCPPQELMPRLWHTRGATYASNRECARRRGKAVT